MLLHLARSAGRLPLGLGLLMCGAVAGGADPIVMDVWPGPPPGETATLPAESDLTKPTDPLIAGRAIIKLGNVTTPQIAVHRPDPKTANGAAVVVCPGGGHSILAYDLEGTEVADWLNAIGVTAIVLKYRVPAREGGPRWRAAVEDAQRAVRLVRHHAAEWGIDPGRVGICGFSAGGETAARTALGPAHVTAPTGDPVDAQSCRPDFVMLIYPAYLVPRGATALAEDVVVTPEAPPMFFVHAFDDNVTVLSSLLLAAKLKEAGVPAELHVYARGGHGYGLRPTEEPVTRWPDLAATWMDASGWLAARPATP